MKILYLAHRIPYPPNKGEKIRVFNQIRQLAKKHTIHICCFADDPDDLRYTTILEKYCASVEVVFRNSAMAIPSIVAALIWRQPLSIKLFYRKEFAALVYKTLEAERFDCVIISCSSMAQYVSSNSGLIKIIDFIDVDSEKWRLYAQRHMFPLSLVYRLEAERLSTYEDKIAQSFDHSILSSQDEVRLIQERVKERPVSVISNGVDLEYFSSSVSASRSVDRSVIVFTGVMDYFPNVDAVRYFCREIFPRVRETLPTSEFYIVGRNPTRQVKDLANQSNVIVTGTVPDVRPYFAQARVAVAPFRVARGVQNKILEAMAMGVPVVGTSETFKGIAATQADGIRIADDPASFAGHVIAFLQASADARCQFAKRVRSYVERHHRWEDQGEKLERILIDVMEHKGRSMPCEVKSAAVA